MNYRRLGKTDLMVSEIGLGAEWLERHTAEECKEIIERCEAHGINILDCWMSEPNVRSNIGTAIEGRREKWYIQGTSVLPSRTASMCAPAILNRPNSPSVICSPV